VIEVTISFDSTHSYPPRREAVAALEQRGFSCQYLEGEIAAVALPAVTAAVRGRAAKCDLECWSREILGGVNDFEAQLTRLKTTPADQRHGVAAQVRELLKSFEAAAVEHCRTAQSLFAGHLGTNSCQELYQYHERLGVDMDRFERQIASYELSGDPIVLLTLGSRIVRELRDQLSAEKKLLGDLHGVLPLPAP
jgi:hypothetical protein